MLTFQWKREWISVAALTAMLALSALMYPQLPDTVPIHWDVNGQPDNFAPRLQAAIGLPLASALVYALLYFAPLLDPKRASLERSADTYVLLRTIVVLFFPMIHALALFGSLQEGQMLSVQWLTVGMGLFFVLVGNYMPRMKPSWIAGIRTPWTLSSERVWTKTHRVGGRLFVAGGLVVGLSALFPGTAGTALAVAAAAMAVVFPIAYSYWLWRQDVSNA